jgi:uncharacterized protein (DUF2132 family)
MTAAPTPPTPSASPKDPLHGVTLQALVEALVAHYGWPELAHQVPVRCFTHDPSVASSLKFLRKTPWAREKVEGLYLYTLRQQTQQAQREAARAAAKERAAERTKG